MLLSLNAQNGSYLTWYVLNTDESMVDCGVTHRLLQASASWRPCSNCGGVFEYEVPPSVTNSWTVILKLMSVDVGNVSVTQRALNDTSVVQFGFPPSSGGSKQVSVTRLDNAIQNRHPTAVHSGGSLLLIWHKIHTATSSSSVVA